ncbi:MAG: hypothetical protein A2W37_01135 [Chloroflexi bacterium RBG_16_63_12]|nr:MAG: hypothetical protein A2W37_01135 [Chloroflexi bacterium RBG_16_63_12]
MEQFRPMKKLLLMIALTALVLAACGSQPASTSVPTQPALTPTPPPPTATPFPPTATATVSPTAVVSPTPEVTATKDSLFASVTHADWQTGPANARVTLVEYGDYQ